MKIINIILYQLREFVQSTRNPATKAKLTQILGGDFFSMSMFQKIDVDKSGELTIDEFMHWGRLNWIEENQPSSRKVTALFPKKMTLIGSGWRFSQRHD